MQAATVARKCARRSDDTMARHDHRDGVAPVGQTDGTRSARSANLRSNLAVAANLSVRDGLQGRPHLTLERSACRAERKVEFGALPGEVLPKLMPRLLEMRGILDPTDARLNLLIDVGV